MKSVLAEAASPSQETPASPRRIPVPHLSIAGVAPTMADKLAKRARGIRQSPIRGFTRDIEARGGVNLGQGVCALPPHPEVLAGAHAAIEAGHNSYTVYDGVPELKSAILRRLEAYNDLRVGLENLIVTSGATGAFESICKAFLEPGDEVIVIEPIYQYHHSQIRERGGVPKSVRLYAPEWSFDPDELEAAFTEKTKLFVFSNPNNPSGKVFTRQELQHIGDACRRHGVVAVVDECYEYILGEGQKHVSLASLPGMFEHTLTMGSASKTLFVTGWRIGWLVGPEEVMTSLGVKYDETYICAPAPFQHAVAHAFGLPDEFFLQVKVPFQQRRDRLAEALVTAGFRPHVPQGAYYMLAEYGALGWKDDIEAMHGLLEKAGVGAVAGKAFFPSETNTGMLRFCFAVSEEEIDLACEWLTTKL